MRRLYSRVPASLLGRGGRVAKPDLPPGLLLSLLLTPIQPGGDTWNHSRDPPYMATPQRRVPLEKWSRFLLPLLLLLPPPSRN